MKITNKIVLKSQENIIKSLAIYRVFSKPNILDRAEAAVLRSLGLADGYASSDLVWYGGHRDARESTYESIGPCCRIHPKMTWIRNTAFVYVHLLKTSQNCQKTLSWANQ
jgi:hypothetical protein